MERLSGKVAFVTGGGGGIGRAVCRRYLAEGARVIVTDINAEAAADAVADAGDRALGIACDVGEGAEVKVAIDKGVETFGALHILTNIAGGSSTADGPVSEAPEEEFWRTTRLDLFGTFLTCKYAIPHIIAAGGGAVVNLTSLAGLMALPGRDCYTAAKGGVAALTRSMAAEFGAHNARVNAIAPGTIMTPRVAARANTDRFRRMVDRSLLGPGKPDDVAYMAVYLASDEARIVTGQVLSVDSGVTIS